MLLLDYWITEFKALNELISVWIWPIAAFRLFALLTAAVCRLVASVAKLLVSERTACPELLILLHSSFH